MQELWRSVGNHRKKACIVLTPHKWLRNCSPEFYGTQPHSFVYCLWILSHYNRVETDREAHKPCGPQNLKYLLLCPLQKKFANFALEYCCYYCLSNNRLASHSTQLPKPQPHPQFLIPSTRKQGLCLWPSDAAF